MRGISFLVGGFILALLIGWFVFPRLLYSSEQQPLQFSHKVHAGEQAGIPCADCHTTAADGRFQGLPPLAKCAECHSAQLGETAAEKRLVDEYVTPGKEVPWHVYQRQPDNAHFPHAVHTRLDGITCATCHGPHETSDSLRSYEENRISGYSRDIWGPEISGISSEPWEGMKMDKCVRCHEKNGRRDGCIDCHK
jgi:menaquinone reductase, multiheme cytochrome c subunit